KTYKQLVKGSVNRIEIRINTLKLCQLQNDLTEINVPYTQV
ncbi:hypothetical protein LX97_03469, partial [Nonlabens dokdonensis]